MTTVIPQITVLAAVAILGAVQPVSAQVGAGPLPLPNPAILPSPQDRLFPGPVRLAVDATDTQHGVITVHEGFVA